MPCSPPRKPAAGSRSDMHSAFERSGNKWQHPWSVGDRLRSLAQTAAMRMLTKCAARTDPRALLLGAPQIARAAVRLPRRWAAGPRDVGARTSPQPTTHAGVAGGCAGLLKGFAHATESRAHASGVAPIPWCAATSSARDCKRNGADARRAGPGQGIAPAEVPRTRWAARKSTSTPPTTIVPTLS